MLAIQRSCTQLTRGIQAAPQGSISTTTSFSRASGHSTPRYLPAFALTRPARVHSLGVDFNILFFLATDAMSALELTFEQGNIELSCPAESPAAKPFDRSALGLRRTKDVPKGSASATCYLDPALSFLIKVLLALSAPGLSKPHKRAGCSLILLRH